MSGAVVGGLAEGLPHVPRSHYLATENKVGDDLGVVVRVYCLSGGALRGSWGLSL